MMVHLDKIKPIIRWSKYVFTPFAFGFFGYIAWHSSDFIVNLFNNASHTWLSISIVLWISLHFISPVFTSTLLMGFSLPLKYKDAFTTHNIRLPAKYIPGGIWHSVARTGDYISYGISSRYVAAYLLMENIFVASVTLFLGGLVVASIESINTLWLLFTIGCSIGSFTTIVLMPILINNRLYWRIGPIQTIQYIKSTCYMLLYWVVASVSFICYIQSFSDLDMSASFLNVAGIYLFSWGVGFISIFAPQGIGISEYVTSHLLGSELETVSVMLIISGFRIIVLIADMLTWIFVVVSGITIKLIKFALTKHLANV